MERFTTSEPEYLLFHNIQRHINLDEAERAKLMSYFKMSQVHKKTKLLHQGKVCNRFYFVVSGSLKAYHVNVNGKESTVMFAFEDWWITDMEAFIHEQTASISIEALEDCVVLEISYTDLQKVSQELPKLEKYFRILFQRAYVREQRRVLNMISKTVEERYLDFLKEYPRVVEKVTQKQIASYLGVTPEFFSTVKNNIPS